jgi:hypothetical protein
MPLEQPPLIGPHEPSEHPDGELEPIDICVTDISFFELFDPHEGQTTSSAISCPLWKISYKAPQSLHR